MTSVASEIHTPSWTLYTGSFIKLKVDENWKTNVLARQMPRFESLNVPLQNFRLSEEVSPDGSLEPQGRIVTKASLGAVPGFGDLLDRALEEREVVVGLLHFCSHFR